jgi:hypothetical protein
MMPLSTFFFSLKYFKVVIEIVPLEERFRRRFQGIIWSSYVVAIILFGLCFSNEFLLSYRIVNVTILTI